MGRRSCLQGRHCGNNDCDQNWGPQSGDRQCLGIKRSKHPDGISGPLKTGLSDRKRIFSGPNTTELNIDTQTNHVIMQLCHPRRTQKLVTRVIK